MVEEAHLHADLVVVLDLVARIAVLGRASGRASPARRLLLPVGLGRRRGSVRRWDDEGLLLRLGRGVGVVREDELARVLGGRVLVRGRRGGRRRILGGESD